MSDKAVRKSEDMLEVLDLLIETILKENQALKKHDLSNSKELLENKKKYTNLYQEHMDGFVQNPDWIEKIDDELKSELDQAANELDEVIKENKNLLSANITANKKLVDTIINEVRKDQTDGGGVYQADGSMTDGSGNNPSKNSLNLDETL
jgi:molecular chaperone DnaK (HSP70)